MLGGFVNSTEASYHAAPDTSAQRTQALPLLNRQGMTRLAEFSAAGITATTVDRMERAGEVVRLARGLYQPPDAAEGMDRIGRKDWRPRLTYESLLAGT